MKKIFYIFCFVVIFAMGCQPTTNNNNSYEAETQVGNNGITETRVVATDTPSSTVPPDVTTNTASPTMTPEIVFNKISNEKNTEAKLINQCPKVTDTAPISNSIVVLRSLQDAAAQQSPNILLIDMSQAQPRRTIKQIQITPNWAITPDRKLIAYEASTIEDGKVTQLNLVIANGNFQTQNSIPWNDQWDTILGWATNRKLIISSAPEATSKFPVSYILVDPLNGTQQEIHLGISDLLDKSLYDFPYWDGWHGLSVDPTLKLAVYPRKSNVNKETYTYALWNIPSNKTMFSLEKVFSAFLQSTESSPMPSWSEDGTQFVFVGVHQDQNISPQKFDLFLVNLNGDTKQLTNLSSIGYVWPSVHSWSPDNNDIAFFLSPAQESGFENANLAIVDIHTLEVTDFCLSVGFQGSAHDEPMTPIWSPNGKQILIVDRYETDHQRVLILDIEKNVVFPIAEDAEPIGWMVTP